MKIYVASKFEKKAEVVQLMAQLRAAGHNVIADWTSHSAAGKKNRALTGYLRWCAEADREGVRDCDAIVLLHAPNCRGGFVELGMALGYGKLVCVLGGAGEAPVRGPIFYALPDVHHFDTAEGLVKFLHWAETEFADVPDAEAELLAMVSKVEEKS